MMNVRKIETELEEGIENDLSLMTHHLCIGTTTFPLLHIHCAVRHRLCRAG